MLLIRPIEKRDNPEIKRIIRKVLEDFDVPKEGSAYADKSLDDMFGAYQEKGNRYFVVEEDGRIMGGGGIAPLQQSRENICELQKMYFLPEARGKGIGKRMLKLCLQQARDLGYEKCYLETMSDMHIARSLYSHFGFKDIDNPIGNTGHYACSIHMLKTL